MYKYLLCMLLLAPLPLRAATWGYIYHGSELDRGYLENVLPGYTVLALTGWKLDAGGNLLQEKTPLMGEVLGIAAREHITVYPVITLQSPVAGTQLLQSKEGVARGLTQIREMIRQYGFTGIHLDFEYLPPSYAQYLGLFLDRARKALPGCALTMAVFPPVDFPPLQAGFHDLEIIAPRLDAMVLMCYDYHRPGTGPGPVTDTAWAERNIFHALRFCKPGRLWLGIPAYGYRWDDRGRATVVTARQGAGNGATRHPSGTLFRLHRADGRTYRTYLADSHTGELLRKLALDYGLAGTALWRLGFEKYPPKN